MYLTFCLPLRPIATTRNATAIKDMASNLEQRWREMVADANRTSKTDTNAREGRSRQSTALNSLADFFFPFSRSANLACLTKTTLSLHLIRFIPLFNFNSTYGTTATT